jgi:hypothetical protein
MSTTSDHVTPGNLWHLDLNDNQLVRFDSFANGIKPEGMALRDDDNSLMIVFDQGLEDPLFHMRDRF